MKSNKNTGLGDWSWKGNQSGTGRVLFSKPETSKQAQRRKRKEKKKRQKNGNQKHPVKPKRTGFYATEAWMELRAKVLEHYGCACMMCGRTYRTHKVVIHVDHIKPISKFPELALVFDNLQVLCGECNVGKKNFYQTDYRPDIAESEILELDIVAEARARI